MLRCDSENGVTTEQAATLERIAIQATRAPGGDRLLDAAVDHVGAGALRDTSGESAGRS